MFLIYSTHTIVNEWMNDIVFIATFSINSWLFLCKTWHINWFSVEAKIWAVIVCECVHHFTHTLDARVPLSYFYISKSKIFAGIKTYNFTFSHWRTQMCVGARALTRLSTDDVQCQVSTHEERLCLSSCNVPDERARIGIHWGCLLPGGNSPRDTIIATKSTLEWNLEFI